MNTLQMHVNRQIKGEIYDALRKGLVAQNGKSKSTWAEGFIKEMLKEAKSNPAGPLGQLLAKQIMQEDILESLDSQTEKLLSRDVEFLSYRIIKQCYREQQNVLLDETSKFILVNTGRRTGKTNLAARWLVKKCTAPNTPCLYVHLKFDNAIKQCYDLCIESAEKAELGISHESKNEGYIEFVNGSSIKFFGNSDKSAADKLRGGKYRGIVIDEAAFECNMNYLVNDILTPTMADYADSQLVMCSTPPRIPHTFYENAYRSGKWTVFEWNAKKNPFIPDFNQFIRYICDSKGIEEDDPFIKREALGEFVYDIEAMVFKGYRTYKELPNDFKPDKIYIGADWGFNDYTSFVPLAVDTVKKIGYVLPEKKFNHSTAGLAMDEAVNLYNDLRKWLIERNPNANPDNVSIICDTNEAMMIYELVTKRKVRAYKAYKYDKDAGMSQLIDLVRTMIYVPEDGVLADEFERTVYKRDEQDNILNEVDDEVFHPDAVDALLYASRQFVFDAKI